MVRADRIPEAAEERDAGESQDAFLRQAVARVAAVQMVRQRLIARAILPHGAIEEVDWHLMPGVPAHGVPPRPHSHGSPLNAHRHDPGRRLQVLFG